MTDARLPILGSNDRYGARSFPETEHLFTRRRLQRWSAGHERFFHRTKNGVNDPLTFYHVVHVLLTIRPNEWFTSRALVEYLVYTKPMLLWDAVTVGRVLGDLEDTFREVNGAENPPIQSKRYWNGTHYALANNAEARTALVNLLDDLDRASEEFIAAEASTEGPPKRLISPLASCPSLLAVA